MKKNLVIALLFAVLSNLNAASYGSSKLVTYIGKSNFMTIGATTLDATLTISTPGIYVLTEDIASAVTSNQVININTDNVTLDLNGYTITGQSASSMNGIEVAATKKNIEIKNGTIYSVGNAGIKVNNSVQNLKINNIIFNTCNVNSATQSGGIAFVGGSNTEIEHCTVDNCVTFSIVPQTSNAYGIYAKSTRYLTIKDCRAEAVRNIGKNQNATGYYVETSEYPSIINSNAYRTEGGDFGAGVYLLTCTGTHLENCTVQGSTATDITNDLDPGTAYGFYFNDTNNSLITRCNAINNAGQNAGSGFYIVSCRNNRFLDCIAEGNHATSPNGLFYCTGFETTKDNTTPKGIVQGCMFKNCTAIGQHAGLSLTGAAGFLLGDYTKFCIIENCLSVANEGGQGQGYGIFLNGDNLMMNIIKNNNVFSNSASTNTNAFGIYENVVIKNTRTLFYENVCADNASTAGTAGADLTSGKFTIPIIGTDLDTFESSQSNIKGYNFVAAADNI